MVPSVRVPVDCSLRVGSTVLDVFNFYLEADPNEQNNLIKERAEKAQEYQVLLENWINEGERLHNQLSQIKESVSYNRSHSDASKKAPRSESRIARLGLKYTR